MPSPRPVSGMSLWSCRPQASRGEPKRRWPEMIYSYTPLSHYLACPRKYRYRYLDGWQEKETRAGLLFGRAFESALAAYFHRLDATEALFKEWSRYQHTALEYAHGDSWDRMFQQGIKLLELFAQHDRVEIRHPKRNLQIKIS